MKRFFALTALLVATVGSADPWLSPQAHAESKSSLRQPRLEIKDFTLKNGLKVYIVEQHHAPVFTLAVTYNVGSRDEVAGRTGFAHLFEHMMFQGSANVGKAEHFVLINNYGGSMNGSTSFDRTNYFETMPSNQLEMVLFLESDRMRSLDVSQDNLDNQRNAVQEERRLNYDNRPYGTVYEKLFNLTYDNFAYKHSTIGSMADLNAASLKDVQDFFTRYYAPNNAVITLVGDVTAETALPLIEKYFGDIPSQPQPVIPDLTEALNKGERRMTWEDPQAPQPRIDMAYPTLEANSTDYYALDMLSTILGGSESSRIYQKLVKEKAVATSAGSYALMRRGSSPLTFSATVAPGSDAETVEKLINEEIVRVQNELVTDEELASARTTLRAQLVDMLSSSRMTATIMGELAVYFGSPQLINEFPAYYQALTAADLKRVAQKYLQPSNRGVVITLPAAKPAAAPASGPAGK